MESSIDDSKTPTHVERQDGGRTTVRNVKNVALADANAKQQPSLLTRRMFMVGSLFWTFKLSV